MQIKKDKMTVTDTFNRLVDTERGITCGCMSPKLIKFSHINATSYYHTQYKCDCGNTIEMYIVK